MTANKDFKRRVRARARRTGESYTAALRHLRRVDIQERMVQWQRVDKPEFGYAVDVPAGWIERPPNLKNSPWETARFADPDDRRHSVIVFRGPGWGRRDAVEVAERVRPILEGSGFVDFQIERVDFAGRPGARLDCVRHDAGRVWAVREYFLIREDAHYCLGCGSAVPGEDDELFTAMAARFRLHDSPSGAAG